MDSQVNYIRQRLSLRKPLANAMELTACRTYNRSLQKPPTETDMSDLIIVALELSPELLNTLLKDHSLSTETEQVNIFRATDNYADRGEGYQYCDRSESMDEIAFI